MYKWAIVGTGWISKDFAKSLKVSGEEVTIISSRNEESAKDFARENNIPNFTTNLWDELDLFDTVYIATPNIYHYEIAKKAISLGKNVMVEKPMTHSHELTKELYKLAEKKGVRIMEAYVHICNPILKTFSGKEFKVNHSQLSSKIKNDTYKTASAFLKEKFGGVIPDLGVYPLALSIYFLGNVLESKIYNIQMLNGVEMECDIELKHEFGTSKIRISKLKDADRSVYLDGKKILDSCYITEDADTKMLEEIKLFTSNENLEWHKKISIEVARVIQELKNKIDF